jgi:hypothetical protein
VLSIKKVWGYPELEKLVKTLSREQVYSIFPWGGCVVVIYEEKFEEQGIKKDEPILNEAATLVFEAGEVKNIPVAKEEKPKSRRRLALQDAELSKER